MKIKMLLAAVGTIALLAAGPAYSQSPPDTPPATTAKPKPKRSAASLACSKQADEKNLHGTARKKFRAKCIKDWKG